MEEKIKILLLLTSILFQYLTQFSVACEIEAIVGGGYPCDTSGRSCAEIFLPKKSPASDGMIVLRHLGYVYKSPFAIFCGYTVCLAGWAVSKEAVYGYLNPRVDLEWSSGGIGVDWKKTVVYTGPNCDLVISGKRESVAYENDANPNAYTIIDYVPSCKGNVIERAFCLAEKRRPVLQVLSGIPLSLPILKDCTDRYKDRCSVVCGGDGGCLGVFPNSIGCCDDYCVHFCMCDGECKVWRVNWKDLFKVVYIINGVEFEAKDDITYYAGPSQNIDIRMRVEVREEYKNRIKLEEEEVEVVIERGGERKIIERGKKFGEEIILSFSMDEYGWIVGEPEDLSKPLIRIIPSITKKTPIGPYGRKIVNREVYDMYGVYVTVSLPLQSLAISPVVGKYQLVCSKIELGDKQYVVLPNRSVLYDPNWELWNKCCRDEIINISLESVEKIEAINKDGVTEESEYAFTFKVKDNRDPICEKIFGEWELYINARYTSYIKPLERGANSLEVEVKILPGIFVHGR